MYYLKKRKLTLLIEHIFLKHGISHILYICKFFKDFEHKFEIMLWGKKDSITTKIKYEQK